MYQLIKSLPIVLVVFFSNNLFSHDGETHKLKGHSKADMLEQCVEPTEVMQKEHFGLLYHQRDKIVDNKLQKNLKKTMNLEQDTTSVVRYFNEQNNE